MQRCEVQVSFPGTIFSSVPVRRSRCKRPGALPSRSALCSSLAFEETRCSSVWSKPFPLKTRELRFLNTVGFEAM